MLVDFSERAGKPGKAGAAASRIARIFREFRGRAAGGRVMRMRERARDIHFLAYMIENDLICRVFWIICEFYTDERHYGGYQVGGIR